MTTITFVRHGNTDFNREKRTQGHLHNPLNETGIRQAEAVARRLSGENWDVLLSSDLMRARQTAEMISAALRMPVTSFDARLREIGRGRMEGTTEEERIAKWGAVWRDLDLGEESHASLRERGMSFIRDITAQYPGQKVLAISHGVFLGQTLKALLQDETTGDNLSNTSVTTIAHNGQQWEYVLYACTRHLLSLDSEDCIRPL